MIPRISEILWEKQFVSQHLAFSSVLRRSDLQDRIKFKQLWGVTDLSRGGPSVEGSGSQPGCLEQVLHRVAAK